MSIGIKSILSVFHKWDRRHHKCAIILAASVLLTSSVAHKMVSWCSLSDWAEIYLNERLIHVWFGLIWFFKYISVISVLGSDVIYSEEAVTDLVATLLELCGSETTIFLAGELRNGMISVFHSFQRIIVLNSSSCCRCNPWVLSGSCNEEFHNWACGSDTVASRILQQPCCFIHSSEEVMKKMKIHVF